MDLKKIYFTALISFLIIILVQLSTYGYYSDSFKLEHTVSLGYNKIELVENYNPPDKFEKGISFTKKVAVKNNGNKKCYLRIKSIISDSRVEKDLTINYNVQNYIYNESDGFWYYKNLLNPSQVSEDLYTTIKINENADDIVLNNFKIYTYCEAIQAENSTSLENAWQISPFNNIYQAPIDSVDEAVTSSGKIQINKKIKSDIICSGLGNPVFLYKLIGKDDIGATRATFYIVLEFESQDIVNQASEEFITKSVSLSELPLYKYEVIEEQSYRYETNNVVSIQNSSVEEKKGICNLNENSKFSEVTFESSKLRKASGLSDCAVSKVKIQAVTVSDVKVISNNNALEVGTNLTSEDFKYFVKYSDGRIKEKDLSIDTKLNNSKLYTESTSGSHKLNLQIFIDDNVIEKEVDINWIPSDYYTYEIVDSEAKKIEITGINSKYNLLDDLYIVGKYNGYNVKSISDLAFENSNVKNLILENGIEEIGNYSFKNSKIETITLDTSLKTIKTGAFNCDKLQNINYYGMESDFNAITVGEKNEEFQNAQVHYIDILEGF